MKLALLIPTLLEREDKLQSLLDILQPQITPQVEVITLLDNREMKVGDKRQQLLEMAQTANCEFCCFVDDDDTVAPTYITDILGALDDQTDCVGFKVLRKKDNIECVYSMKNTHYYLHNKICQRPITHLNPIRTGLALRIGFKPVRYEDIHYSEWLQRSQILKKEVFIDKVLYFYNNR